jgi:hypothetical protein
MLDYSTASANNSSCPWYNKGGWNSNCVKCPSGYYNTGLGWCARDVHIYARPSYGRGVETPMKCEADLDEEVGIAQLT